MLFQYWTHNSIRFFLIIFSGLIGPVATANAAELKLATETIRSLNQKGLPYIDCAFSKLEHSYQTTSMPWARAQLGTEHGLYDGFFMASRNDRRDEYAVLSEPFFNIEWLYIVTKESGISPDNPDFFQKRFAANRGSARHSWLVEKHESGKISDGIVTTPDAFDSLKMLALERVDIILENNINIVAAYKETGYSASDFTTFIAKSKPVGIYISKSFLDKNPSFLSKLNKSIISCKSM